MPLYKGGVGDRGAERFPDFVPWDVGVGEAVVFGVGVGLFGFAVGAEASDVRCCVEVFLVMLQMLRWVRLVMPSSGAWVVLSASSCTLIRCALC